jgi:nucleoside-triphosphatase THEP1
VSLALLIGDRQSGKTSTCRRLAEAARAQRLSVGGILAPAVCEEGSCTGYDVLDLATGRSTRLAVPGPAGAEHVGCFGFLGEGLAFGRTALARAAETRHDLVIVDEVGPLELSGGGWSAHLDPLIRREQATLFAVRRSLLSDVTRRWKVSSGDQHDLAGGADRIIERLIGTITQS